MSSLDLTVVKTLFESLDKASHGEPVSFRVEVSNKDGMGQLRVIVCDELTYNVLLKGRKNLLTAEN
jgi:hypothetical protein